MMKTTKTKLPGVLIIEPDVFGDDRGFFMETYQQERYAEVGIDEVFVQDNHSYSARGVLRGLHLQITRPQGKLVWTDKGNVFDVAVDINPESDTYGQHVCLELSETNHAQMYIPPGYAHGFMVLSETADFYYKWTDFYYPDDQAGIIWNDPDINIDWPIKDPGLSEKDKQLPTLQEFNGQS
jgi:dTDP-4-dehydrorhamnose 3,5-epimerase